VGVCVPLNLPVEVQGTDDERLSQAGQAARLVHATSTNWVTTSQSF
jgi:hypothetical protein